MAAGYITAGIAYHLRTLPVITAFIHKKDPYFQNNTQTIMFAANFFNLHTNSFDAAVRRQPQKRAKLLGNT